MCLSSERSLAILRLPHEIWVQGLRGGGSKGGSKGKKVAIIGSGNFASALAPIIGKNCERLGEFETAVNMWVYEEDVDGRKLSEIINTDHENTKYLPGIKLPENIIAVPSVQDAVKDANVLIFCVPHQVAPAPHPSIQNDSSPRLAFPCVHTSP